MTFDPDVAVLVASWEETVPLPFDTASVSAMRAGLATSAPVLFGTADEIACVHDDVAGSVPVRVYRPEDPSGVTVYFHGGGWVVGNLDTHDGICRTLAARSGTTVVAVDYRLAPEHRFPAALDDAWTAFQWAADGRTSVVGDSAGGNLAAVVAVRARDAGIRVARQVLVYPVLDVALDLPSSVECADAPNLTTEEMRWYWREYLGGADGSAPDASPLRTPDLAGVAPALLILAGNDPLRDEGLAYAERLRAAGVDVRVSMYAGAIHGFFRMPAALESARRALDEAASALAV